MRRPVFVCQTCKAMTWNGEFLEVGFVCICCQRGNAELTARRRGASARSARFRAVRV